MQFLLGDAIISSKTDLHNGSKKEKGNYGKVKKKTCRKYCHLFGLFILNNKAVFCDAFAG